MSAMRASDGSVYLSSASLGQSLQAVSFGRPSPSSYPPSSMLDQCTATIARSSLHHTGTPNRYPPPLGMKHCLSHSVWTHLDRSQNTLQTKRTRNQIVRMLWYFRPNWGHTGGFESGLIVGSFSIRTMRGALAAVEPL